MTAPDPTMDADTKARMAASDANLAGIIAGRRRAAARLLATDPGPAHQVRVDWEPIRQAETGDDTYRANVKPTPRTAPREDRL